MTARFIDRVGKGIRDAPRDALVADIAPEHLRGASIGLRQSMDTIGAFVGPSVAIALLWWTLNDYKIVFWVAVIPAFMAVVVVVLAVREPERPPDLRTVKFPLSLTELKRLGSSYWWVVIVAMVFTLARFSEAFLILRANAVGLPISLVPLVLVVMNVVYALSAYPAGVLSDRVNRTTLLIIGFGILVTADLVLEFSSGLVGVTIGVILWGLQLGLTQGLLSTLVADAAPAELRGTAYGVFNLVSGLALLAASITAGTLWDLSGPQATFLAGAAFTLLALIGLVGVRHRIGIAGSV